MNEETGRQPSEEGEEHGVKTGDLDTQLAHERTDRAMERRPQAAERTLMAWIRTSLYLAMPLR